MKVEHLRITLIIPSFSPPSGSLTTMFRPRGWKGAPLSTLIRAETRCRLYTKGPVMPNCDNRIFIASVLTRYRCAIQPTQRRSATVTATEKAVLCKLTEPQLSEIASQYPDIWRFIAKELARRLEQRNAHVTATHDKIRIFIISSAEALEIARTIQNAFEYDFTVVVWTDGVFRASWYPIESLERQLDQSDFAIAVAQPDDITHSRGQASPTTRDNVIFELGMFIGRIGRLRSFLIEPRGEEVKLPSDLSGITALTYRYDPENLAAAMGPACNRVRAIVRELGPNN